MKQTWIIAHKAFEIFLMDVLDGFDVLKLYLHRLPAKAATVSGSHFWKKIQLPWNNAGRIKYILQLKTSKVE